MYNVYKHSSAKTAQYRLEIIFNYSTDVTLNLCHMFCVSPVCKYKIILQTMYGLISLLRRNFVLFQ